MNDWCLFAAPTSPPRRSSIWGSPFPQDSLNYVSHQASISPTPLSQWGPAAAPTLTPSANIWGAQLQQKPPAALAASGAAAPVQFKPSYGSGLGGSFVASHAAPQSAAGLGMRKGSVGSRPPSLSSTNSSSSLWFEDQYLVSPPPSPQSSPVPQALRPASPVTEEITLSPTCGPLYLVRFKGERTEVYTAPGTAIYYPGDAVMVDADRGRDLGVVFASNVTRHEAAALKLKQQRDRQQLLLHSGNAPAQPAGNVYTPKQILGHASPTEYADMAAKAADEKAAVALCNQKAADRNLDLSIVDAEYQWDRRKLTFFYTASARVDFRELVRELFRVYKTRIWMCATSSPGASSNSGSGSGSGSSSSSGSSS